MPQTHTITTYAYTELDADAQARARDWFREGNLDYEWWDSVYEDAERIGLRISEFDLNRRSMCKGELTGTVGDTVQAILAEHGAPTDTYKLAQAYYQRRHDGYPMDEDEFTGLLCEKYRVMLQDEMEYLQSDENAEWSLTENGYEFTAKGEIYY